MPFKTLTQNQYLFTRSLTFQNNNNFSLSQSTVNQNIGYNLNAT